MIFKNKEVLVVDDDQDILKLARKILEGSGLKVHSATNIKDAFEILVEKVPHLVLLDLNIASDSGITFLQNKKKNATLAKIPTILITSDSNKKMIALALASGATDYMSKPFRSIDIIQKAKKLLKIFEVPKVELNEGEVLLECSVPATMTHLNEVSCLINSTVKFGNNQDVKLSRSAMNRLNESLIKYKTVGVSYPRPGNAYMTKITFLGVDETTARKIRVLKVY